MTGTEMALQAVSTVGFPIAAYVMMWQTRRQELSEMKDAFSEQANELRALRKEQAELREEINA